MTLWQERLDMFPGRVRGLRGAPAAGQRLGRRRDDMAMLPKDVLATATRELLGAAPASMSLERLHHLITVTQHATDLLLNEIERRGELGGMFDPRF